MLFVHTDVLLRHNLMLLWVFCYKCLWHYFKNAFTACEALINVLSDLSLCINTSSSVDNKAHYDARIGECITQAHSRQYECYVIFDNIA